MMPVLISAILQLLGRRVFLLDDARHLAVLIAHDAAVAAGIVERDGEHAVAASARAVGQRLQRAGARERHVAVQHQRGHGRIEQRQRLLHRVAGAELLLLHGELDVRRRYCLPHGFGAMTDHHDQTCGLERACSVDDMSEERPAGQGMEHLGKRGPHALTGACRQNHDVHGVGNQTSLEPTILSCSPSRQRPLARPCTPAESTRKRLRFPGTSRLDQRSSNWTIEIGFDPLSGAPSPASVEHGSSSKAISPCGSASPRARRPANGNSL